MGIMSDDRFEDFLKDAAPDYRTPPATPREEMWGRIQAARRVRSTKRPVEWHPKLWWGVAAGVAALLTVGIAIGRWSVSGVRDANPSVSTTMADATEDQPFFQLVSADYLQQTDLFLSLFRTEAESGAVDSSMAGWAWDLLTTTRLMLASPAGEDVELRPLLEDLELILIQIARYGTAHDESELEFIKQDMNGRDVELRLRARLSAAGDVLPVGGRI
jgi:hypothetical protein